MAVMTLIILAIWTAISPIEWVREEVDDITGESFGRCQGENVAKWFTPIVVIMIISIALTLIMAWKTKDVDEAFSETWWIFALIFVQLQVRLPLTFWCKFKLTLAFLTHIVIFSPDACCLYASSRYPPRCFHRRTLPGIHIDDLDVSNVDHNVNNASESFGFLQA
jgi:hypothetical protein